LPSPPKPLASTSSTPARHKKFHLPFSSRSSPVLKPKPPDASVSPQEQYGKPREIEANPYPLIRLPYAIQTERGILQPGMYLLEPYVLPLEVSNPLEGNTILAEPSGKRLMQLTKRHVPVLRFELSPVSQSASAVPSPLEKTDASMPDSLTGQVKRSADGRTMVFQFSGVSGLLESLPFVILNAPQQETVR
jgi:hypothetical protein